MKIKAIIASVAAAGTLAFSSAAAFADEPVANDVLAAPDSSAADENVADDILIAPNPTASVTAEDVYAKAKSYFAEMMKTSFESAKEQIAAAGGAEAYTAEAMKNFTPEYIESVKKELIAMAVQNGADEAEITKSLEPITADFVQMFMKDSINLVDSSDSADAFVDNTLTYSLDFLKSGIEAAGGVDALTDAIMAEITDEQLAEIKAALVESGAATAEELEALTKESIKETVKETATILANTKNVDEIFINALNSLGEEQLATMSAIIDESIKALENPNTEPEIIAPEDPGTGENPDLGENPDTGVESVAAIVGVIAVAGAVVVISRKKA